MPEKYTVPQQARPHQSAFKVLMVLVVSVFSVEALVMVVLPLLPAMSDVTTTLLDASLLSTIIFPVFYFLVFRPLTQRIAEQKITEGSLQLAASVFSHAREGIIITDADGNIVDVNETFTRVTGYSRQEAIGQNPRILKSGRQTPELYVTMWQELTTKSHWTGEIWNRRKDGQVYAEILSISAVPDASGKTQNYVALFSDITSIKDQLEQLERIAHFDALTGLPNRVLLSDRLRQAMLQCQRHDQSMATVYLDLDGFKEINDTHGHDVGDQLLITLGQRMKTALREGDTLARIGGDEFVAVLADLDHVRDCEPVLERLLQAAADPLTIGETTLQVSASVGVAFYPMHGIDVELLLRHADRAMYAAKQAGKNQYQLFNNVKHNQPAHNLRKVAG